MPVVAFCVCAGLGPGLYALCCNCDNTDLDGQPCGSSACSRLDAAPGEVEMMVRSAGSTWGASADTVRRRNAAGAMPSSSSSSNGLLASIRDQLHSSLRPGRRPPSDSGRQRHSGSSNSSDLQGTLRDMFNLKQLGQSLNSGTSALVAKIKRAASNPALAVHAGNTASFGDAADAVLASYQAGGASRPQTHNRHSSGGGSSSDARALPAQLHRPKTYDSGKDD